MKVAFYEIEDWERRVIKRKLRGYALKFIDEPLNEANVASDADAISVFITSKVNEKILKKFKNLKAVATRSTGYDHISLSACKKRKIIVANVPSYGENTVAEHAFAMLLSLSRKIHKTYLKTSRGDFSRDDLRGFDLKGKTIGIVGLGRIGGHAARIANGFEMNVIACDRDEEKFKLFPYAKRASFEEILKSSDVISLHCPLTKETYHMLNKRNISKVKRGAIIVNTARGDLIETEGLIYALNKKIIGGACLDVLEGEPLIKEEKEIFSSKYNLNSLKKLLENHVLLTYDNVIITPHNAFNSNEAVRRIIDTTIENIKCIKNGECKNRVA